MLFFFRRFLNSIAFTFIQLDVIIKERSTGKKMFFIQQGIVEIRSVKANKIKKLADGCYFGGEKISSWVA